MRSAGRSGGDAAVAGSPQVEAMASADLDAPDDALNAAAAAGLRYVVDAEPGIRRVRCGRGFTYRADRGDEVTARDRARIAALAIPPAWTDVWICADARGHLQATGRDTRSRKQYRYHTRWREVRDGAKFDRLGEFGAGLGRLRTEIAADLAAPGLPRRKVEALVLSLLDRTLIRVGNEEYRRDNGSFGLTTLQSDHVEVSGTTIEFCFVGKGGREHTASVRDRRLARAVRSCHELGGRELFTYLDDRGDPVRVDSSDCNEYLASIMGMGTTVKYFRTWGASVTALELLAGRGGTIGDADVLAAVDEAAERLGNTRAVCRRSYVHPLLTEEIDEERIRDAWSRARTTATMTRAERALLHLLDG